MEVVARVDCAGGDAPAHMLEGVIETNVERAVPDWCALVEVAETVCPRDDDVFARAQRRIAGRATGDGGGNEPLDGAVAAIIDDRRDR